MSEQLAVRQMVARGAELLDRVKPEWFTLIDLGTLDMALPRYCILGQLYGNYWDGLELLELTGTRDVQAYYGFDLEFFPCAGFTALEAAPAWAVLQDEWKAVIADRLGKGSQA